MHRLVRSRYTSELARAVRNHIHLGRANYHINSNNNKNASHQHCGYYFPLGITSHEAAQKAKPPTTLDAICNSGTDRAKDALSGGMVMVQSSPARCRLASL